MVNWMKAEEGWRCHGARRVCEGLKKTIRLKAVRLKEPRERKINKSFKVRLRPGAVMKFEAFFFFQGANEGEKHIQSFL